MNKNVGTVLKDNLKEKNNLVINLCNVNLKNPLILASGIVGFFKEYDKILDVGLLGGVVLKGLTLNEKQGNNGIRIAETPSGIINSIGLQNPGLERFLQEEVPHLNSLNTVVVANVAGESVADMVELVNRLQCINCIDMIELNISCPNVECGGIAFGNNPKSVENVVKKVRVASKKPLIVKLSPNVSSVSDCALAAELGGADIISLINTVHALAVDINTKKILVKGGLSGACIKPIGLRAVYECAKVVKTPLIGIGGIQCANDVIQYMMCGATAVQIGTSLFSDVTCIDKIIMDLVAYMDNNNIKDINEMKGVIL